MKRPNFNEKTEVKVIAKDYASYGSRGTVVELAVTFPGSNQLIPASNKEAIKQAYLDGLEPRMIWYAKVKFNDDDDGLGWFKATELEAIQHKFVDIDYIREDDLVIGKKEDGTDAIRPKNTGAFEPGDIIQITTKIDGANASIAWDETTGKLEIFSRTNLLDSPGALRGFYDYIKTEIEPKLDMSKHPSLVIFGEWCVGHTIKDYNKEWFNKWRVYDIFDKSINQYWCQDSVKSFCRNYKIEYIEELYYGSFISWEHCKSFLSKSIAYGPTQEGIVVKNQTKLKNNNSKYPCYLKIVNNAFMEHQHSKKEKKTVDPAKALEKQNAEKLAATIITEARVKKLLLKLIDDGKLSIELKPTDMGIVMKLLPKCVFDDVLKEEKEIVVQLGEFAGKVISQQTANIARRIIVGSI